MADEPMPSDPLLPLDELLAMAAITEEDVQEALDWWRENASETWKDALDEAA